jgi:hypothetical protein
MFAERVLWSTGLLVLVAVAGSSFLGELFDIGRA